MLLIQISQQQCQALGVGGYHYTCMCVQYQTLTWERDEWHLFLTDIREEHGVDEGGLAQPGLPGQHQVEAETPFHCSSVDLALGLSLVQNTNFFVCQPDMAAC